MEKETHKNHQSEKHNNGHYKKLLLMAVLSFISMYVLMYTMVDKFDNAIPNVNQFYMAGLMAAPMVIIEILLMRSMYHNRKMNTVILAVSSIALIVFFFCVRQQTAVTDKQFLKSMIPHHAAALLMGKEAKVQDPEVQQLIENIIISQQREIDFMKEKLQEIK